MSRRKQKRGFVSKRMKILKTFKWRKPMRKLFSFLLTLEFFFLKKVERREVDCLLEILNGILIFSKIVVGFTLV